ncbi:chemotaxis protein CheD [Noviherbaspirillum denitrificans]|uniref:Probable chemoreceptor glutamine deamidase CheD n=2 Tax=Noviherbaspirillum denitrificans TaxID=1968433 RepID=A0A254TK75_9BURK|nr:chemotaxis protein CheD [Noviherbaspirillum denitrificans]
MEVFLQPGEVGAGSSGHVFKTLLGSCVSITLWHPRRRVGAMSHFLLPTRNQPPGKELDGRYADEAVPLMRRHLMRLGVDPMECQAKIFGGGRMFASESQSGALAVGRRNGDVARELLNAQGIVVVAEDLFGYGHRKLVFDVATGDVWSCQVQPGDPDLQGAQ